MRVPVEINAFLAANHVLSLGVADDIGPWAASLFYAYDPVDMTLSVMTSKTTRHGHAMLGLASIAGTIAGQPKRISDIIGIQFIAELALLQGDERRAAFTLYCRRHPAARLIPSEIWRLRLMNVKLTENRLAFARKLNWRREPSVDACSEPHLE